MSKIKSFIYNYFIADELTVEVRTLNYICFFSALASIVALISRLIAGFPFQSIILLFIMSISIFGVLFISIKRIINANILIYVVVYGVSIIFWPLHFYTVGGYESGMAVYFAMAIILDFMLLKGKPRIFTIIITCAVAAMCYISTIFWDWRVLPENGLTDYQLFIDAMQSIIIVGLLTGFIIIHQTKLFQIERNKAKTASEEIKRGEELLTYLNEASVILLTAEPVSFEATLSESMEKIAAYLEIDCIYIWRAAVRDNIPVYEKLYSLLSKNTENIKTLEMVSGSNILNRVAEWDDRLFENQGFISEPVGNFGGYITEVMTACGMNAITAFPVFFQNEYWGFISFDNRHSKRLCTEREAAVLRSSSMLLANAVERNENMMKMKSIQITNSSIFESNPHINVMFDSKFKIIDCNPAAMKFMGFETKDELRAGFIERISKSLPEYQSGGRKSIPISERFMTTIKEGFVKFTTDLILNGEERSIDAEFKKIPYGDSFAIVAYVFDMTEVHKREMDLKKAREQNEMQLAELNSMVQTIEKAQLTVSSMFVSNPHINILFDSNFKVIDCNPAAVEFMGFETKEEMIAGLVGKLRDSLPETLSTGRKTRPVSEWFMTAATEGFIELETEFILDGETRIVNVELKRIPYGDSFAIVGYILDITDTRKREMELKQRDQQLSEAVKEARAANEAKSSFLSTMSHEIRTPMNAIIGITEILLQNSMLEQDTIESLNKIYTSGDMLLGIINDILDLSKIEAGKLELVIDKYEIASLISDTAQLNMMRIGSKPIEFELYVDENVPMILMGDELRVKQIMNNILSNAFKYTAAGTVTLSVGIEPESDDGENVTLVISVSDTGQGMSKKQVDKLFDEYSRFNMQANRSTEGTGLGMSITRNLLRLMNGKISVESEPGKGSTFTVSLPQGKNGTRMLGKEIADNLHNFRTSSRTQMRRVQITRESMPYGSVLIVDDVETNIYVARGLLTPYDLKIDSVDSGFGAIEKIKHGRVYDIIFMDHMMPKMDGIEATKIIRSMGYEQPIVALTANAVAGQADIFLGNGFDDFISKPIDVRQLNAVLNKLIRDKQPEKVIQMAEKQAELKKQTAENDSQVTIDPRFAEAFARDALKSIAALDAIDKKGSYDNEDDLRTYVIHVHGMKSALANIGNMELSAIALKLEMTGRDDGNIEVLKSETPGFLSALKAFLEKITVKNKPETDTGETTNEDTAYLHEKLLVIKTACEEYDESTADNALTELRDKTWSQSTKTLINNFSEYLLHSDFDVIVDEINKFIETQK